MAAFSFLMKLIIEVSLSLITENAIYLFLQDKLFFSEINSVGDYSFRVIAYSVSDI